jgi:hypothetical protein
VIENLACINYDTNNLLLASYDWRLSYYNLEVRDGFFSRFVALVMDPPIYSLIIPIKVKNEHREPQACVSRIHRCVYLPSSSRKRQGKVVLVG